MAFGATITITENAVAKILNRINQDGYGSEYYLRDATSERRIRIRHSKESPRSDGTVMHRHNVEYTHTTFATPTVKEIVRSAYVVIRNSDADDLTQPGYLVDGFVNYLDSATVQSDLLNWLN